MLAELAVMAADCASGAKVAWLVGSEGVGKSTLARLACEASGLQVHRLDVYPEDREHPLAAVNELGATFGITLGTDPAQDLLRAIEAAGPMALVIEDAQWMDEASQLAVWQVVRRFRRLPVWLVVTSTDIAGPLLDGLSLLLRSPDRGQVVTVTPLRAQESAAFLKEELGVPVDGETLEMVQSVTGGYPSLLVSLADQVRLSGQATNLRRAVGALAQRGEGSGLLRQHVTSVLENVTPGGRGALLALAQGGELTAAQLSQVLRLRGLPDSGTDELLATGLAERAGATGLRLRHQPARRAIEERMTWNEARDSHAALATLLTGLDGLEHRVAAADESTSGEVLIEVLAQLADAYASNDLGLAFRLAIHAADLEPTFMIEAILAALRSGRISRLIDIADRVDNMPPSVGRTAAMTILELSHESVAAAVDRLMGIDADDVIDPRELVILAHASIQVVVASSLHMAPELSMALSRFVEPVHRRGVDLAPVQPDLAIELRIISAGLEAILIGMNDAIAPAQRIEPLTDLVQRLDPVSGMLVGPIVGSLIGILHYVTGDLAPAKTELARITAMDIPLVRMQSELALAHLAFLDGDWDTAHALADKHLAATLDSLQAPLWPQSFAVAALVPAARGEAHVVAEYLGWQDASTESTVGGAAGKLTEAWGLVATDTDPKRVAELLDRVWARGDISYVSGHPTGALRVRAHLQTGNRPAAEAALVALENEPYEAQAHAYATSHASALLAEDAGETDAATEAFATAARHLRAQARTNPGAALQVFGAVLAEDWALAVVRLGAATPARLVTLLRDSIAMLTRAGATLWRDRLVRVEHQLTPAAPPVPSRSGLDLLGTLTSREREVALLVADGLSNREIAGRLFVTVRTAEYHVHNVLTKIGMTSRAQLQQALGEAVA